MCFISKLDIKFQIFFVLDLKRIKKKPSMMSRQKLNDQHQPVNYDLSPFMPNNLSRSVSFQHDVS